MHTVGRGRATHAAPVRALCAKVAVPPLCRRRAVLLRSAHTNTRDSQHHTNRVWMVVGSWLLRCPLHYLWAVDVEGFEHTRHHVLLAHPRATQIIASINSARLAILFLSASEAVAHGASTLHTPTCDKSRRTTVSCWARWAGSGGTCRTACPSGPVHHHTSGCQSLLSV